MLRLYSKSDSKEFLKQGYEMKPNLVKLGRELKENRIVLMIVEPEDFYRKVLDTAVVLSHNFNKICYITITRPYELLKDVLIKKDVDTKKFFFIDFVTERASKYGEDVEFVSPNNLTDFGIAFSKAIEEIHVDSSIFDNVSPLLVYNSENDVLKFLISMIGRARDNKILLVLILLKTEREVNFAKELFIFVDKVL